MFQEQVNRSVLIKGVHMEEIRFTKIFWQYNLHSASSTQVSKLHQTLCIDIWLNFIRSENGRDGTWVLKELLIKHWGIYKEFWLILEYKTMGM